MDERTVVEFYIKKKSEKVPLDSRLSLTFVASKISLHHLLVVCLIGLQNVKLDC